MPDLTPGQEFLVNSNTAGDQSRPAIAALTGGGYVVGWADLSGPNSFQQSETVRLQLYSASGETRGGEITVSNPGTSQNGGYHDIGFVPLQNGDVLVTWVRGVRDGLGYLHTRHMEGQVFSAQGESVTQPFTIVESPSIDGPFYSNLQGVQLTDGEVLFTVNLHDRAQLATSSTIGTITLDLNAPFEATGEVIIGDGSGHHSNPHLFATDAGAAVIWNDQNLSFHLSLQHLNSDGTKSGAEYLLDFDTSYGPLTDFVAARTGDGNYVIAWTELQPTGGLSLDPVAIRMMLSDEYGNTIRAAVKVNEAEQGNFLVSDVIALPDGRFMVTWTDNSQTGADTSGTAARAQIFDATGAQVGSNFVLSSTVAGDQAYPVATVLADGRVVSAWQDGSETGGDPDGWAIRAQMFGTTGQDSSEPDDGGGDSDPAPQDPNDTVPGGDPWTTPSNIVAAFKGPGDGSVWATGTGSQFPHAHQFAALQNDGRVFIWGSFDDGYLTDAGGQIVTGVEAIYATSNAFAALRGGAVMTWGGSWAGGNSDAVAEQLSSGVQSISTSRDAFSALKQDGSVVVWGADGYELHVYGNNGVLPDDFVKIFSSSREFAGIRSDGSVVSWNWQPLPSETGSDLEDLFRELLGDAPSYSDVAPDLQDVVWITSASTAFAALTENGRVVAWDNGGSEQGNASAVAQDLQSGIVALYSNKRAFAALDSDGALITWGSSNYGGDSSEFADQLSSGVVSVTASEAAFAALKSDGSVISWGFVENDPSYIFSLLLLEDGEEAPPYPHISFDSVAADLGDSVARIYSNSHAFAALKNDGAVVAWGHVDYGGNMQIPGGVEKIYSNKYAFAAVTTDGAVIAWGHPDRGGDLGSVAADLSSGVTTIYATAESFSALRSDGSVVTWGDTGTQMPDVADSLSGGVIGLASPFGSPSETGQGQPGPAPEPLPNRSPVADLVAAVASEAGDEADINIAAQFFDPDGDPLTFTFGGLPEGVIADGGQLTGIITAEPGEYTVTVTADDGRGGVTSASFVWSISAGDGPVVIDQNTNLPQTDLQAIALDTGTLLTWREGDSVNGRFLDAAGRPVGDELILGAGTDFRVDDLGDGRHLLNWVQGANIHARMLSSDGDLGASMFLGTWEHNSIGFDRPDLSFSGLEDGSFWMLYRPTPNLVTGDMGWGAQQYSETGTQLQSFIWQSDAPWANASSADRAGLFVFPSGDSGEVWFSAERGLMQMKFNNLDGSDPVIHDLTRAGTHSPSAIRVITRDDGEFLLLWHDIGQNGVGSAIMASVLTPEGQRGSSHFTLGFRETPLTSAAQLKTVELPNGDTVVLWAEQGTRELKGAVINADGETTSGTLSFGQLASNDLNDAGAVLVDDNILMHWKTSFGNLVGRFVSDPQTIVLETHASDVAKVLALPDGDLKLIRIESGDADHADASYRIVGEVVSLGDRDINAAPQTDASFAPLQTQTGIDIADLGLNLRNFFEDPDGDDLTIQFSGLPRGVTGHPDGTLSGNVAGSPGTYTVSVTADDGRGGKTTATFDWTINHRPWVFSYDEPADIMLFAHMALDAYNGDRWNDNPGTPIRPAEGWEVLLTSYDGLGPLPVDYRGNPVPLLHMRDEFGDALADSGMQATAYREIETGRVIIAYRGTDDSWGWLKDYGELINVSLPLGAGLPTKNPKSHLDAAIGFYNTILSRQDITHDDLAITGHSLGGMLAGYIAAAESLDGMLFATGPHNQMIQTWRPANLSVDDFNFDNVYSSRIVGEFLGEANDRITTPNNLAIELDNLNNGSVSGLLYNHSMAVQSLYLQGDFSLGLSGAYKKVLKDAHDINDNANTVRVIASGMHDSNHNQAPALLALLDTKFENAYDFKYGDFKPEDIIGSLAGYLIDIAFFLTVRPAPDDLNNYIQDISWSSFVAPANQWIQIDIPFNYSIASHNLSGLVSEVYGINDFGLSRLIGEADRIVFTNPDYSGFGTWYHGNFDASDIDRTDIFIAGSPSTAGDTTFLGAPTSVTVGTRNAVVFGTDWDDSLNAGAKNQSLVYLLGGDGNDTYTASSGVGSTTVIVNTGGLNSTAHVPGVISPDSVRDLNGSGDLKFTYALQNSGGISSVIIRDFWADKWIGERGDGHIRTITDQTGGSYRFTRPEQDDDPRFVNHVPSSAEGESGALVVVATPENIDRVTLSANVLQSDSVEIWGFDSRDEIRLTGLPSGLTAENISFRTGSIIVDVDENLDGNIDYSFRLVGDYDGYTPMITEQDGEIVITLDGDIEVLFDLVGTDGNDTLQADDTGQALWGGAGDDLLIGGLGDDTLDGGDGNDTLDGGGGQNVMYGGAGDDLYIVRSTEDRVIEYFDEGHDIIRAWVDFTLPMHVEELHLQGSENLNATGNIQDNILVGNDGNNTLRAMGGDNVLTGGAGDDTLIGGAGQDIAVYRGARENYDIQTDRNTGITIVTDLRDAATTPDHDGTDTLTNIETLRFADMDVSLAVENVLTVSDRSGMGMSGVTLHMHQSDEISEEMGLTDEDGRVTFMPEIAGEIRITGSKEYDPSTDGNVTALDALNVLRLAVGLSPSWGTTSPMDFIAADINQDGRVTALDALEVLRAAVGLEIANQPRWFFMDSDADLSHIDRNDTRVEEGIRFDPAVTDMSSLSMTGVLLGNMQEYAQ